MVNEQENRMNPGVDSYLSRGCGRCPLWDTPRCKVNTWRDELTKLRMIILDCGLTETVKWGVPCYTLENNNVVLLHAFKEYCAINFFKGALLKDSHGILIQQTENVQAGRQIRFNSLEQILAMEQVLKGTIQEAIEVEKAGLKVNFKDTSEFTIPEEFQIKLDELPALKKAFYSLTPGRQRGYLLFFSAPKLAKTRLARVEKCIPQILNGKGLND